MLSELLGLLPKPYPIPVLLVQHISEGFEQGFAAWLSTRTGQPVHLATAGQRERRGGKRWEFYAKSVAPVKTGRRKQVSTMEQLQNIEQVLPREESNPGRPNPCAAWSNPRSEA